MALFSSVVPMSSPRLSAPSRRLHATSALLRVTSSKRRALSVRCEQSSKPGGGGAVDVWLGRLAMMSFSTAVIVEVSTGKGFVANLGLATPAPALALVVTALVAGLAVLFIFQSGNSDS